MRKKIRTTEEREDNSFDFREIKRLKSIIRETEFWVYNPIEAGTYREIADEHRLKFYRTLENCEGFIFPQLKDRLVAKFEEIYHDLVEKSREEHETESRLDRRYSFPNAPTHGYEKDEDFERRLLSSLHVCWDSQ